MHCSTTLRICTILAMLELITVETFISSQDKEHTHINFITKDIKYDHLKNKDQTFITWK